MCKTVYTLRIHFIYGWVNITFFFIILYWALHDSDSCTLYVYTEEITITIVWRYVFFPKWVHINNMKYRQTLKSPFVFFFCFPFNLCAITIPRCGDFVLTCTGMHACMHAFVRMEIVLWKKLTTFVWQQICFSHMIESLYFCRFARIRIFNHSNWMAWPKFPVKSIHMCVYRQVYILYCIARTWTLQVFVAFCTVYTLKCGHFWCSALFQWHSMFKGNRFRFGGWKIFAVNWNPHWWILQRLSEA